MFDHFSTVAPIYERLIPPPDPARLRDLLELTPGSDLLDAAGGTGRIAALYADEASRVVVCDTSAGMLKEAQNKGLQTVQAAVEELPFKDNEFDAILLVDAFHHLENQRKALKDLLRVLKPTGILVIEEPDIHRPLVKIVAFLEKLFLMRSHFVPVEIMVEWINAAGGSVRTIRKGRFRVWLQILRSGSMESCQYSRNPTEGHNQGNIKNYSQEKPHQCGFGPVRFADLRITTESPDKEQDYIYERNGHQEHGQHPVSNGYRSVGVCCHLYSPFLK